jgi:hypothetical protein
LWDFDVRQPAGKLIEIQPRQILATITVDLSPGIENARSLSEFSLLIEWKQEALA